MNSAVKTTMRWMAHAGLLACLPLALAAQTPTPPPRDNIAARTPTASSSTLKGRVTRMDTGEPIARAVVSLKVSDARAVPLADNGQPRYPVLPEAITDEQGQFEITGVPPGNYRLSAWRTGFATVDYGQRSAYSPARTVTVRSGESLEQLNIAMPRGAVLTGQVLDGNGQPVAGAEVQVYRRRVVQGRVQLVQTNVEPDAADDRGVYRLFGVPNGTYVVSARHGSQTGQAALGAFNMGMPTFYPGTADSSAARAIVVTTPAEISGLSFPMVAARPAMITVVVTNADGTPAQNVQVRVSSENSGAMSGSYAQGKNRIGPFQAGRYTVSADDRKNGAYAAADVLLEGTDLEVPLVLMPGRSLRGRIAFASGTPPAGLTPRMIRGALRVPDAPGSWARSELFVADDWTFEIKGLGGTLRLEPTVLRTDVVVSGIVVGDRESIDGALDFSRGDIDVRIVLSQRLTAVSGRVLAEGPQPASDATVMIFPEEASRWGIERHVATVRTESNGTFSHRGLPPGRYRAIAVDSVEDGSELDPEFLERLKPEATPITLAEDETSVVDLSIVTPPTH